LCTIGTLGLSGFEHYLLNYRQPLSDTAFPEP
jgi:hypothetical protein